MAMLAVDEVDAGMFSDLATERLEAELCSWAGHIAAATCKWLLLVAEYDRREAWWQWECTSMAQWLAVHVGISVVTARQHVAVARKLGELPAVREAFGRGELSFSRVRALCRIATPAREAELLQLARAATAPQLERIVADTARAVAAMKPGHAERVAQERQLSWWVDDEGRGHISAAVPPEVFAAFVKLLNESVVDGPEPIEQRRADAFARLLGRVDVADPAAARRPLVVVHTFPDGSARAEGGAPLPMSVVESLGGDEVTATHTHDGKIRYSRKRKRRRRFASRTQRRHVLFRDRCCAFPGCHRTDGLQMHHVAWFGRDHGETESRNLVPLCPKHHGAVHHRGWTIMRDPSTGRVVWRRPDGRLLDPGGLVPGGDPEAIVDKSIGPDTIVPTDHGGRYDHELTVWMLANRDGWDPGPDTSATPSDGAAASPTDHPTASNGRGPRDAAASPTDHAATTTGRDPRDAAASPTRSSSAPEEPGTRDPAASPTGCDRAANDAAPHRNDAAASPNGHTTASTPVPTADAAASPTGHSSATAGRGTRDAAASPAGRGTRPSATTATPFATTALGDDDEEEDGEDDAAASHDPWRAERHGGVIWIDDDDTVHVPWRWEDDRYDP